MTILRWTGIAFDTIKDLYKDDEDFVEILKQCEEVLARGFKI